MEFNERLRELRKQRDLTQEELAAALYVSRTAVSKWESGRGYPGIDSLKAIAGYFSVTVDALLTGEDARKAAEEAQRQKEQRFRARVFGVTDCAAAAVPFLPLFAQRGGESVTAVPLTALENAPWLRAVVWAFVLACVLWGVLTLARQASHSRKRETVSLLFHAALAALLAATLHPYAAAAVVALLAVKALMRSKTP